ncbi:hypothetical protein Q7P37_010712 [Cladosporium fusiforme]
MSLRNMQHDEHTDTTLTMASYEIPSQHSVPPINLLRGWPNPSLLPADLIKHAANAALSNPSIAHDALLYGPDPGYEPAREAIAEWLTDAYSPHAPIPANRLCITGGASQNLGCLLNVFTDPAYTRTIWIIAPAYFLSFRIFEDAGFGGRMRAVPEDGDGLDIAFLEREIMENERQAEKRGPMKPAYKPERARAKVYKHVVYCVPTFGNPSSRTMTLRRRQELVRLARRFDALLVADDVYDFLQWSAPDCANEGPPNPTHLPRLVDVDRDIDGGSERDGADGFGNAASNGSFSKIAGPGVRCGWVEGTKKFAYGVSQTGTTCSGGAPSQMTSTFLTHLLTTNQLQQHIEHTLIPSYAARYRALHNAISTHLLPLGFTLPQPTRNVVGGFFVWLSLPEGVSAGDLARVCREQENVIVAHGAMFEVPGDRRVSFGGNVRLCFTWEEISRLEEGVLRIASASKKMMGDGKAGGGYVLVQREVSGSEEFK